MVWAHQDYSGAQEQRGISVTLVHSGEHKVDGNPYEPLPEGVRTEIQGELDELRQLFAVTVSNGRNISVESVLATEARMYMGQAAVDVGFADAVMSKDQAFQTFKQSLSSGSTISLGVSMSDPKGSASTSAAVAPSTASTEQAAEVAQTVTTEYAFEQANAQVAAEQTRIFGIVEHASATGRMASAIKLAKSGMSIEDAAEVLETIPLAAENAQAAANQNALTEMAAADVVEPEVESNSEASETPRLFVV